MAVHLSILNRPLRNSRKLSAMHDYPILQCDSQVLGCVLVQFFLWAVHQHSLPKLVELPTSLQSELIKPQIASDRVHEQYS